MFHVRRAEVGDALKIVELLQEGFPSKLLPYTIFGCEGIAAYLRDGIRCQELGDCRWHVASRGDGVPLGFVEVRETFESHYLNHVFVSASARGMGVGTALMLHALTREKDSPAPVLEIDAFADNVRPIHWYERIGLRRAEGRTWAILPLDEFVSIGGLRWYASGLPQADLVHGTYGFSEFQLHTPAATYRMGRLGTRLFRVTTSAALADPCVLAALQTIDPGRSLLCIDKSDAWGGLLPKGARILAQSVHLKGQLDEVLRCLAEFRTCLSPFPDSL